MRRGERPLAPTLRFLSPSRRFGARFRPPRPGGRSARPAARRRCRAPCASGCAGDALARIRSPKAAGGPARFPAPWPAGRLSPEADKPSLRWPGKPAQTPTTCHRSRPGTRRARCPAGRPARAPSRSSPRWHSTRPAGGLPTPPRPKVPTTRRPCRVALAPLTSPRGGRLIMGRWRTRKRWRKVVKKSLLSPSNQRRHPRHPHRAEPQHLWEYRWHKGPDLPFPYSRYHYCDPNGWIMAAVIIPSAAKA